MRHALILLLVLFTGCGEVRVPWVVVTQDQYGDKWPLKVAKAVIGCGFSSSPHAVYIEVDGKKCALNGKALDSGLPRCDEIARSGNSASLSVFIQPALATCETPP